MDATPTASLKMSVQRAFSFAGGKMRSVTESPRKLDYFSPEQDRVSPFEVVLLGFLLPVLAIVLLLFLFSR